LTAKKANETNIKKYIRENKKRAADLKTLESVASMNSALDILKRINDATPAKSQVTLDVKRIDVKDGFVAMEGYVSSPLEMTRLQKALTSVSSDGTVRSNKTGLSPLPGKTSFSFNFNVDRGIAKTIK
jgi:general secretion pathway protein L